VAFTIGTASASGITDVNGYVAVTITLAGPAAANFLKVSFAGDGLLYGPATHISSFSVLHEDTQLALSDAVAVKNSPALATATLKEADGVPLAEKTITFFVEQRTKKTTSWVAVGTAVTGTNGTATVTIPTKYLTPQPKPIRAEFAGDGSFLTSQGMANTYRQ
jgi:hypothetical protein